MTVVFGKDYCNALLVINMGCEMMYVLHHRLEGLEVELSKQLKTLQDIA